MTCVVLTSIHKTWLNSSTCSVNELKYTCLHFPKSDSIISHNWIFVHYLTQDEAEAWFSRCIKITMMECCLVNCHSVWQRSPFCEVWKLSQSPKLCSFITTRPKVLSQWSMTKECLSCNCSPPLKCQWIIISPPCDTHLTQMMASGDFSQLSPTIVVKANLGSFSSAIWEIRGNRAWWTHL